MESFFYTVPAKIPSTIKFAILLSSEHEGGVEQRECYVMFLAGLSEEVGLCARY